jgi:hypothetical protein
MQSPKTLHTRSCTVWYKLPAAPPTPPAIQHLQQLVVNKSSQRPTEDEGRCHCQRCASLALSGAAYVAAGAPQPPSSGTSAMWVQSSVGPSSGVSHIDSALQVKLSLSSGGPPPSDGRDSSSCERAGPTLPVCLLCHPASCSPMPLHFRAASSVGTHRRLHGDMVTCMQPAGRFCHAAQGSCQHRPSAASTCT